MLSSLKLKHNKIYNSNKFNYSFKIISIADQLNLLIKYKIVCSK